jgi:DNA-binding transcriptional regulator YiaG
MDFFLQKESGEMKDINLSVEELREDLKAVRIKTGGSLIGINPGLKEKIVSVFEKSGMSSTDFCRSIGLSFSSLSQWRRGRKSKLRLQPNREILGFKKIAVETSSNSRITAEKNGLILEGPHGLRVVGLTPSDLAMLLRALC